MNTTDSDKSAHFKPVLTSFPWVRYPHTHTYVCACVCACVRLRVCLRVRPFARVCACAYMCVEKWLESMDGLGRSRL